MADEISLEEFTGGRDPEVEASIKARRLSTRDAGMARRVAGSPQRQAADEADDQSLASVNELEREISRTRDPKQKAILVAEHNRIKGELGKRITAEDAQVPFPLSLIGSAEAATPKTKGAMKEISLDAFTGKNANEEFAESKPAAAAGVALDTTLRMMKAAGGEAAALTDLVLSTPGFLLGVGAQLGGTIQAAARGMPLTAQKGLMNPDLPTPTDQTERRYLRPIGLSPDSTRRPDAYTVGREAGRTFSEPFVSPLKKLMDMFQSGEAYEHAKTTKGMEKFSSILEEAGIWAEQKSGGKISRDAVPMMAETLLAGASGIGSGKAKGIPKENITLMREQIAKMRQEADLEAATPAITPEEFVARVPVQKQINDMLGIRSPAEQAKITRQRRADAKQIFRQPEEGGDFGSVAESEFKADERISNEQTFGQAEALDILQRRPEERTVQDLAMLRLGEAANQARAERAADKGRRTADEFTGERVSMEDAMAIAQKEPEARTREENTKLRQWAGQKGAISGDAAALLSAAGIGATVGALLDDEKLRGAVLGGAAGLGPAMLMRGPGNVTSRFKQAGAVKGPGGMWHPEAVDRLEQPLSAALVRDLGDLDKQQAPIQWSQKAIRNYLNKYAGTERDPLKDVEIPSGTGIERWESMWDRTIHKATKEQYDAGDLYGGAKAPEGVKPGETIFNISGERVITNADIESYMSHVGDYLRQNVTPGKLGIPDWFQYEASDAFKKKNPPPADSTPISATADWNAKIRESPEYKAYKNPLSQYDLVRAVRETAENDKRVAKQVEKAQGDSTKSLPVYKAYPDGFRWVELKLPEKLTEEQGKQVKEQTVEDIRKLAGEKKYNEAVAELKEDNLPITAENLHERLSEDIYEDFGRYLAVDSSGKPVQNSYTGNVAKGKTPEEAWLAGRLAEEGNTMGHCVGGYCEGVARGESKIFSLRDAKGKSHVTIETGADTFLSGDRLIAQGRRDLWEAYLERNDTGKGYPLSRDLRNPETGQQDLHSFIRQKDPEFAKKLLDAEDVLQIKGKQNRAPNAEYLPYVQDFVKSGKWGEVQDLQNTGLVDVADRLHRGAASARSALSKTQIKHLAEKLQGEKFLTEEAWQKAISEVPVAEGSIERRAGPRDLSDADLLRRSAALNRESGGQLAAVTPEDLAAYRRGELTAGDPAHQTIKEAEQLGTQPNWRQRAGGNQQGKITQDMVVGLTGLGLGGIAGWAMTDDPSGALLGALAGGSLGIPGARHRLKQVADAADYGLGALSTRIGNISEPVKLALRNYERRSLTESHDWLTKVVPFMSELRKVGGEKGDALTRAILTNDKQLIADLMKGNQPLVAAWRETQNVLHDLGGQLQGHGRFKTMLEDYFPRLVKDVEGLKAALGVPERTRLETALLEGEAAAMKNRGTPLTAVEQSSIINREVQGFRRAKGYQPGFAKQRGVDKITEALQPFYHTPQESLYAYIRGAVQDLELAKFFGKDLAQTRIGGQNHINVETSIGNLVGREKAEGRITGAEERVLIEMLQSRFQGGERASSRLVQEARNLGNMGLLGDIVSAATQLGDVATAIYAQGLRPAITAMVRQFTGNSRVTAKDFGLADHIAEEFVSPTKTADWLQKAFKLSGFTAIDRFGKTTNLNAALIKVERQSRTPEGIAALSEKYGEAYGKEFPRLVDDLKNGRTTERVRSLLFSELSDVQPISKAEMPQGYLDNPNGRIVYMLKTFMLKQMDMMRRDVYNEAKKGNVGTAIKNATSYALVLGLAGATTDMIKDWLLGRNAHFDLTDVGENVLKTFGWSEYTRDQFKKAPTKALLNIIAPPVQMIDHIVTLDPKAIRYIPLIGKLFYSWELGGKEDAELREAKKTGADLSEEALERRRQKREAARLKRNSNNGHAS